MRKLLLFLACLVVSAPAFAQVTCVALGPTATGSGSGANWSNMKAYIPTPVRGTRYYLADGTGYPGLDFTTATSGTSTVEIRKAQSYDFGRTADGCSSGIDVGWNPATMGSGQAVFGTSLYFGHVWYPEKNYLTIEGNGTLTAPGCGGTPGSSPTGALSTPTDCGIKVDDTANCGSGAIGSGLSITGFILHDVEYLGCGNATTEDFVSRLDNCNTCSMTHMYIHNFGSVCSVIGGASHLTFDDNYMFRNQVVAGGSPAHGQCLQSFGDGGNFDVSRNVFRDLGGTAIIQAWVGSGSVQAGPYNYYDNAIWNTPGFTPLFPSANGLLACINGFTCNNVTMSQNTIGLMGSASVAIDSETGGTYTVQNNIWYSSTNNANPGPHGTFTQDHNSYLVSGTGCPTGTGNVCNNTASNPFTASATGDFTLAADGSNVNNRASLSAPFTTDVVGTTFTTDRGAHQFVNPTQATQPSCTPGTGSYSSTQTVTCTNPNSVPTVMCFRTDGVTPATSGDGINCPAGNTKYTTTISVSATETLKIVAGTNTLTDSTVASYTYTISSPAASNPTFSPAAGTYTSAQQITPSTITSGAIICWNYTGAPATNGTTGCNVGNLLAGPIPVSSSATVFAVAGGTGYTDSSVASALYTIKYHAVQLPTTWVNNLEYLHKTSNTISYPASGTGGAWTCAATNYGPYTANSQSSLNQAVQDAETCRTANNSGTTIIIPAGALFSGNPGITLPQTAGDNSTNFIVLTSTTPLTLGQTVCSHGIQDNLPESTQIGLRNHGCNGTAVSYQLGSTITPLSGSFTLANGVSGNTSAYNDVASMYTLECAINSCNALQAGNYDSNNVAPHHFAILNAEIRPIAGITGPNAPFEIGLGSETLLSQIPQHIHLAYSYIHGDWNDAPVSGGVATGGATGANSIPSAIAYRAAVYISTTYNYVDRILRPGSDGQALVLGLAQNIKTVHNWFEGGSEGHICGGESAPIAFTGFLVCQDEEDRANRYTYPYSWMLAADAGLCVNGLACSGNSYERKNAHEYKWGERILNDGDIFENVDNTGAQNGVVISYKTAQTSGGPLGTNYWDVLENYTVTNNVTRNSCSGVSMGYRSDNSGGNGGGVSLPDQIALFQNNLLYNISVSGPGCSGATEQYGWRIANGGPLTTWPATAQRDSSGVTTTLTLTGATGTGVTDMAVGDPVSVSGCSDTTFNTSQTAMGPPALTGTLLNGLIVVYSNPGTASATATGCTLSNSQGWPNYLTALHNTDIADIASPANAPYSSANGGTAVWPLARNLVFQNDIFVNGGINSTAAEGTRTEVRMFDPATLAINNTLMPGRVGTGGATCPGSSGAGCYTEYGGTFAGASPPSTLYLTPTSYCVGSDPTTENCTGILAAMSQSGATPKFPIAINDWNQYRLCHAGDAGCNNKASPYAAGQANQGSDGQDLGFNPVPINAAETSTQYICLTACGTGSFPDVPGAQTVLFRGGILQ